MEKKKRSAVEWAMHYRQIVILVVCCLVAFGIYSLPQMRKNEFPGFTIRQGVVVAVAPGNTAEEMVEQVTKPLENYIFSYKEVKKGKTFSKSRDGIVYIQVELNDDLNNKDEFWSKFKHGVQTFKTQLPSNVLAVQVMDDFGDTSALLITMESEDKTYRELNDYMDDLQDRLRRIPSVGRMTVSGVQKEQISVYLDNARLSRYGLNDQTLAASLFAKGFTTTGGRVRTDAYMQPVYVARSLNTVYDVQQLIVYTDPQGRNVRLKDVARVVREYPEPESYISNNGKKCIMLSVEMKKGQNIVKMGEDINEVLTDFQQTLPSEVSIFRITDQSKVVDDSVTNFLHELVIAIVAVIIVVMLLLPMRVALVAASAIPITIFISLGLFHAFGLELNTVTLAALIVTLGMIVDNSIVIIDCYLEKIGEGVSRWHASIESTQHFFKSIFSATMAISITFFPFLITTSGMIHDFLLSFPWAITLILAISLVVATLLVPFMQFYFIRKPIRQKMRPDGKPAFSFLNMLQVYYDRLLAFCFRWPKATLATGILSIVLGAFLLGKLPQQLMPYADRNQFAVEIYLPTGASVNRTAEVADSLEHILRRDPRVVSVASFKGCASPRFQTTYAPQIAGTNYAQFIVNTTGIKETVELLEEYAPRYNDYFPDARVRFKQLSYSEAVYPVEVRLSGESLDSIRVAVDTIESILRGMPELVTVQSDLSDPLQAAEIRLKEDEASRLGISNIQVETALALRYGSGIPVASVWEGDDNIPVSIKSETSDHATNEDLMNELIPVAGGLSCVPLRQVAEIVPVWKVGQIVRRNGILTATVQADLQRGENGMAVVGKVQQQLDGLSLPQGVQLAYGGDLEDSADKMPPVMNGLMVAALMIFFILVLHFHRVNIATLIFLSMALCLFGTAAGILIQGVEFSITCVLGIVSLMGIIVRNGIIMINYAEELRETERMHVREAIWHSASRRMRPIFLTSAAASMGVIPMILGKSGLWMPMGTVICYGTLITMIFLLTVLPVAYLLLFSGSTEKRKRVNALEKQ
ncbi:efflux RND transporter permease subunit [Phocaeicola coprophilus]|jgi:multidrug efflux pump|uniref:RND transporter, HAE1/HME family, permease protein n=1 Tax=Phocaeicola coprophilus DSM 18228 = JCM 13818 TaxID=547042 RepID=S0F9A9_9BACT|nr:efflux RND transporter permease subunit [Phocaeicola coprophilus]EEF76347.1 RND transporter, HAE1/HME family, permease protein [Phocaeicola coprophilus DSM 18228 = JCM 13818]QRO24625.1 efflux RND transporter permease subunit [Phocaeicola coprophilus]